MKKRLKVIPEFANEEEERKFWEQNDSSDYLDWNEAQPVDMPNLSRPRRRYRSGSLSICWIPSKLRQTHATCPINR